MATREHDVFSCDCHDICGWCCEPWPYGQLRSVTVDGEQSDGICPPCRKDARKS